MLGVDADTLIKPLRVVFRRKPFLVSAGEHHPKGFFAFCDRKAALTIWLRNQAMTVI
jgi:hypothetical protein